MSDDSYPSDDSQCPDDSEWNYILDFFDVLSYHDPTGLAKCFCINQRPANTNGYTMMQFYFILLLIF